MCVFWAMKGDIYEIKKFPREKVKIPGGKGGYSEIFNGLFVY